MTTTFVQRVQVLHDMIGNFGGLALDYFCKKRIMMVYTKGVYTIIFLHQEEHSMQSFSIHLREINDVYKLVNTLVGYDGAVDLGSGRYVVDGRSLLGIFSLDLRQPVNVHVHKDEDVALLKRMLSDFVVD